MQHIPIAENFFVILIKNVIECYDPDSSDSSRLYPNERYNPSVTRQSNSIPTIFLLSAPKEFYTWKINVELFKS